MSKIEVISIRMSAAKGPEGGLTLNSSKCEVITSSGSCGMDELSAFQQLISPPSILLGAPLTTGSAVDVCLNARCDENDATNFGRTVARSQPTTDDFGP